MEKKITLHKLYIHYQSRLIAQIIRVASQSAGTSLLWRLTVGILVVKRDYSRRQERESDKQPGVPIAPASATTDTHRGGISRALNKSPS